MKASLKLLLPLVALSALTLSPLTRAQDSTPSAPPPADGSQPPPPEGRRGPGGRGGMAPEMMVERLDKAVTHTADQKAKAADIYKKAADDMKALAPEDRRTKGREIMQATRDQIRALLTPDQQTKFDAMPQPGRRGGGPGGPGGGKKQGD